MKCIYKTLVIFTISILLAAGCANFSTANTDRWFEYELSPSRINLSGDIIMNGKLSDGSIFSVFFDAEVSADGDFYYTLLMQDFGWHSEGGKWIGPVLDVTRTKLGYIYINPKRQVAIYFYPKGTFDAFKVNIEPRINSD